MEEIDLALRGEMILIDGEFRPATLAIEAGKIAKILGHDHSVAARETIDAGRAAVTPGFVDLHVHFDNPGISVSEDFRVGTANAAIGGVTTVVDHPFSAPLVVTADAVRAKWRDAGAGSYVDFGLWGGVDGLHLADLAQMHELGVSGFKAFLPENDMGITAAADTHLREAMRFSASSGSVVLVHAEDRAALAELALERGASARATDYDAFIRHRGSRIERIAVERVLELAKETGGTVHFVHLSSAESIDLVTTARQSGISASCEVAAHHLLLSADDLRAQGWPALCAPPLRERGEVEAVWNRVVAGDVAAVVSDHCPYDPVEKSGADADPFAGPFGIQGIREYPALLIDAARAHGLSLVDTFALLTTRPAALAGFTAKGKIAIGADADLAVIDLDTNWRIDASDQVGDWQWTPYHGRRSSVRVTTTILAGRVIARDGQIVGSVGGGRALTSEGWNA